MKDFFKTFKLSNLLKNKNLVKKQRREMRVVAIPANEDNYQYLVIDETTNSSAIVDPVDIKSINENIKKENCTLIAAFVTHHHSDHASGTSELAKEYANTNFKIYAGDDKRIECVSKLLKDDDKLEIGNLKVSILKTPCHTSTHVCYFVEDTKKDEKAVFTGDTLFIGGCGRFFEGTAAEMNTALNEKLGKLPDKTKVYCGHEYTVSNLKFAQHVDENNLNVKEKLAWAIEQRKNNCFTVPSTIAEEKLFNPFMRVSDVKIQKLLNTSDAISTMQKLRDLKNKFRA